MVAGNEGIITFYDMKEKTEIQATHPNDVPIEDCQWNPGENYLLVVYKDGTMYLYEMEKETPSFEFDPQGFCIFFLIIIHIAPRCIEWVNDMSGDFIICSEKIGAIRVWAASQKSHKATHKLGTTGIRCLQGFPGKPNLYLAGFKDGALAIYDLKKRRTLWSTEAGHSETVFDTKFKPNNPNLLATGSFDGYVKIWDTTTGKVCYSLSQVVKKDSDREKDDAKIIYSVSWAPGDETKLATSNAIGEVSIWDYIKGKVVAKLQPGEAGQNSRVEWHPTRRDLLACGSFEDGAYILKFDGNSTLEVFKNFPHDGTVHGVSWNCKNPNILATACADSKIRIYDINSTSDQPIHTLEGHQARAFNVAWNPCYENILASGSDDKTARTWDILAKTSTVLTGHTANVRGIAWNYEIPWLLFTGSWDATLRVWDTRNSSCIFVAYDHHSDIYGITSHPERPFVIVSCSRDNTVRFWSVEGTSDAILVFFV